MCGAQWVCSAEVSPPTTQNAPGSKVDPITIGWEERTWAKRTTDDGACFIVDEDDAPDKSKQWFFCSDPGRPADSEEGWQCELVPEWQGTAPDGGHAVWLCSKEKP